jgi:hypothetical protein
MKALTLALLFSLPVPKLAPPPHVPVDMAVRHSGHKGGKWYFAANGHAVYCYGPVMYVTEPTTGGLQRVATFCQNDKPMVPLKD